LTTNIPADSKNPESALDANLVFIAPTPR
jgi:hypothetical protein